VMKKLVSQSYYQIKCPYLMDATRLVIHNTANDAPAMNEINYMINNTNEVSYHFAVDDIQAIQGLPLNRNGWHAGDGSNGLGNRQGIGIEICYSLSGGDRFTASEKNAAKLVAYLLKTAGWGIEKITKHQDYSAKYCPHRTLDLGWQRFINMCKNELDNLSSVKKEPYEIGTVVYNTEDLMMESNVYEDGTKGLLPKNSLSKVYKYFTKGSTLWMALTDRNGTVRAQAWTKQLDKITTTPPSEAKEPYPIGTVVYNIEDLMMESTVYADGTKGLLPKNSLSKVYKYFTKDSILWMALTDGNGTIRAQAWTKQLDKISTTPQLGTIEPYPIGTVVYNTEDLMMESTIYADGTKGLLPKNSLSRVYKYYTKDSTLWMALTDGNGTIRAQAWTKQLDKIIDYCSMKK